MSVTASVPTSDPSALLPAGTIIDERYRIDRVVAEGGMGIVYRARHLRLPQWVAIKVVRPEYAQHREIAMRFVNEARMAARLHGHHVARILDVGRLGSGLPYMVLEYLRGFDLRWLVDVRGRLPTELAAKYVTEACYAMAEAHALGIVHRDLKPENLYLTRLPDGTEIIKVLDFGIAKRLGRTGPNSGLQNHCLGSPSYMAPEQVNDPEVVDARADVWSLGIVLFELLAGTVPFKGDSIAQTCHRVCWNEPVSLRSIRPDLPNEMEEVFQRCVRKLPEERFASVLGLAEALAPFTHGPLSSPGEELGERPKLLSEAVEPSESKPRARFWGWVAMVVLATALALVHRATPGDLRAMAAGTSSALTVIGETLASASQTSAKAVIYVAARLTSALESVNAPRRDSQPSGRPAAPCQRLCPPAPSALAQE